jgi:hypothetical protein
MRRALALALAALAAPAVSVRELRSLALPRIHVYDLPARLMGPCAHWGCHKLTPYILQSKARGGNVCPSRLVALGAVSALSC